MTGKEPRSAADGRPPKRPPTQRRAKQPAIELTDAEKSELCLASGCSLRTIERWAAGVDVLAVTHTRLTQAAQRKGIELRPREAKRRIVGERAA